MNNIPAYKTELLEIDSQKIQFLFESKGISSIIKVIEYTPLIKRDGRLIFNLGFGDYDENSGTIIDDVNSNNGDMWKVFSTVLNTVPKFFQKNKNSAIWVQGSDSSEEYTKICAPSCKKNCKTICRNYNRRIKAYRYFVNKNFFELTKNYVFFGILDNKNREFVQYIPDDEYVGIMVFKKK